jgi:hypothetical protein
LGKGRGNRDAHKETSSNVGASPFAEGSSSKSSAEEGKEGESVGATGGEGGEEVEEEEEAGVEVSSL